MTEELYPDEKLLQLFDSRRRARLAKAWGTYQPRQPIASDLSDCRRYQVMRVIAWKVREPPDPRGMEIIEQGSVMEGPMIQQMRDEGWEVVEDQVPISIERVVKSGDRVPILTGRMDGKIRLGRELVPVDTKDTGEFNLQRINGEADLKSSMWTRKWWRQMQLYMEGSGAGRSVLILGFRGQRLPVLVHHDQDATDEILRTCEWAVETIQLLRNQEVDHTTVDAALLELAVEYHTDFNVCRSCPFRDKACFPPQPSRQTAQHRPELADMVRRLIETKPSANEYNKLYNTLKKETDGVEITIADNCVVEREQKTRNKKAKPATPAFTETYWSFSASRVDDREADDSEIE